MLTLYDRLDRGSRRGFLRLGGTMAIAASGLSLAHLSALHLQAQSTPSLLTGKSVIFLFLHGGPSQFETFDPKMDRPEGIRSATGELATALPGITFGTSFPGLAARANRLNIVRSFAPGDADHNLKPLVGRDSFQANPGAVLARVAGANHPLTGIPTNVLLQPRAVDADTQPGTTAFGRFNSTGSLPSACAPFEPTVGSLGELQVGIPRTQLDDRRLLLAQIERQLRSVEHSTGAEASGDPLREQAFRLLTGSLSDAFDLSKEDPRLLDRYDTAPLVRPDAIDRKWNNYNNYVDNAKSLGKLLLLARRLCERGAGFVTVTTNFVWDMHADVNNATMTEGMRYMGPPLDHALSAFLDDLHARGLNEKILLVACGEMGRTPRINGNGGRDHWGPLGPLLLAGGGLPVGQVIGKSNKDGAEPQSEPITPKHLMATIMHTLFDVPQLRLAVNLPREFSQTMTSWEPIPGLFAG